MYTFSEIEKIFNACTNWVELDTVLKSFNYLFDKNWIKGQGLKNAVYECSDAAYNRLQKQ